MGSRGATHGNPPIMKSSIGLERDRLVANLKKSFSNSFRLKLNEENGRYRMVSVEVRGKDYKHLANDIIDKNVVPPSKVNKLAKQIKNSYCKKVTGLYKSRKDNIDKFYYMKVKGRKLYFNIARYKTKYKCKIKYVYRIHAITKNCK